MSRPESARSWLPAGALVLVVALLFVFVWFQGSKEGDASDPATPSKTASADLSDKSAAVEPVADAHAGRETSTKTTPATTGPGSLRIHVVDADTNAPVANAKAFVENARDGAHDLGSFETDADGRGTVSGLPTATLVVHVLRKPPHASGYAAVEMHASESRDVELRLTAGSTIVGRAVDDATQPMADAEVSIESERNDLVSFGGADDWEVVTRTGPDGRFEIPNIVSRPVLVSIVDGEMRARTWTGVSVGVKSGVTQGYARTTFGDGNRIDVGDIVLPRGRAFAGHVLDARRAPVESALVALVQFPEHPDSNTRTLRASPSTVALEADLALTSSDGSFHAQAGTTAQYASVTTKDGIFEQFILPDSNPPPADLELVLKDWSILEIELVDEAGARVSAAAPTLRNKGVRFISAKRWVAGNAGQLDASMVLDGKRQVHAEVVADADGLFRTQTAGVIGTSRRLHFELPGYIPIDEDIGTQTAPIERRKFTVHVLPTMRVHLNIAEQPPLTQPGSKLTLYIQACLLDPVAYSSPNNMIGKREGTFPGEKCCGQGSLWASKLEAGEQLLELPVLAQGNYWLHAEVPSTRKNEKGEIETFLVFEEHIGPFPADGAVHELKVPLVERPPPQEEHRAPPPASAPGMTSITGRIIDAVTQKGIEYASIEVIPVPNPGGALAKVGYEADHSGRLQPHVLQPGRYSMRMYARKYRISALDDVTIVEGKTLDLGTIALAPMSVTMLHLVEADGRPVSRGTRVDMRGGPGSTLVQASVKGDDGTIELQDELVSGVRIRVSEERRGAEVESLTGMQWLTHDFRPEETSVELRLLKWQPIEVRVSGAIREFQAALVWCFVDEAGATPSWNGSYHMTEVLPMTDGTRVFRGEVGGPGHLQAAVSCTLLQPFLQAIEILDHAAVQTFLLTPIR